jgi:CheY-like chemotaxis protein
MDVRMPRMDGYTAARVMREKESSFIHDTTSVIPISSTNHPSYTDTIVGTNNNSSIGISINENSDTSSSNHHCRCIATNYEHNYCNGHSLQSTPITTTSTTITTSTASRVPPLRTTIIALTADRQLSTGEGRLQITRCGMDDVLIKPINLPGLTTLLHTWLPSTHS